MSKTYVAKLIIIGLTACAAYGQNQTRQAAGIIYFTNNTPTDLRSFPVEILKGTQKQVAVTNPDERFRFSFSNLKPDRYILRLTWPKQCVLSYRLDLRKESVDLIRVIMDAECAHNNRKIRDLPSN